MLKYPTTIHQEKVGQIELQLCCLQSFEKTVDFLFEEVSNSGNVRLLEDLCPYFGVIWPGARVLASYVLQKIPNLNQVKMLELGCGLALPSLVSAKLGATVTASDFHPDVPSFLAKNLSLNNLRLHYKKIDWTHTNIKLPNYDYIVGSDILYEKKHIVGLLHFLRQHLRQASTAMFVDPKRPYWEPFRNQAADFGFSIRSIELQNMIVMEVKKIGL